MHQTFSYLKEGSLPYISLKVISCGWRQGIRTVVAVNDSQLAEAFNAESSAWQEQWVYWPGA